MASIECKVNTSGINKMLAIAQQYSKRTPAEAANTAALVVARFAWSKTAVTTVERIDIELAVLSTPVLSTRGPRKGQPLKSGRRKILGVGPSTSGALAPIPLAWLLISARAKDGSRYNVLTGSYWQLAEHPLTGRRVSDFAAIMLAIVTRMISARHSSTKFLQSSWIPAIRSLEPYADPSIVRRRAAGPPGAERFVEGAGYAIPARSGDAYASAEIGNAAGTAGSNAVLSAKHNEALVRIGGPALQQAIDDEAENMMKYVAAKRFKEDFSELRASGFIVDV